jgi:hypothetical protein
MIAMGTAALQNAGVLVVSTHDRSWKVVVAPVSCDVGTVYEVAPVAAGQT